MDIHYFDLDSFETMRESLNLKSNEQGYIYKGGVISILETVQDRYNNLPFNDAIIAKASFLLSRITQGHHFVGGNKRTGLLAMSVFLAYNSIPVHFTQGEGYLITLQIVYDMIDDKQLRTWIKSNIINKENNGES